jgi:cation transport regulator ChaC
MPQDAPKRAVAANDERAEEAKKDVAYVFGYGSLINPESRAKTGSSGEAIPVEVTGLERRWNFVRRKVSDKSIKNLQERNENLPEAKKVPPGVLKALGKLKGKEFESQKSWLDTLIPILAEGHVKPADFPDPLFRMAALGVVEKEGAVTNGVIVAIPRGEELEKFDQREDGYTRKALGELKATVRVLNGKEVPPGSIWVYVPDDPRTPGADCPIAQTYVDVVLAGCILQFGESFARKLVESTKFWEYDWVDDRHRPTYARAASYYDLAKRIDTILAENVPRTLPRDKKARRVFHCP